MAKPKNNQLVWETVKRKVNDLLPWEGNPRRMTKKQAEDLTESLRRFNLMSIPVINRDGRIISGHQRIKILQLLGRGDEEIDVRIPNRLLSEEEYIEANLRENKNVGEWDESLLANIDKDVLLDVGFDYNELSDMFDIELPDKELQTDPDDAPEATPDSTTQYGELFICGPHRILCADASDSQMLTLMFQGISASMIVADPPYGVEVASRNEYLNAVYGGKRIEKPIASDRNGAAQDLLLSVLQTAAEFTDKGASLYVFAPIGDMVLPLLEALRSSPWGVHQILVWVKNNHALSRMDYNPKHEFIFYGWKKNGSHAFYGKGGETTVWECDRPHKSEHHPTMKPVALIEKAIRNSSKEAEIVYDPFLGSGSTLIACEQTGRCCFGVEIDPIYVDVSVKRWEAATGRKAKKINLSAS